MLSWHQCVQAVLVHQLSKKATQNPFRKNRGRVVQVAFHPGKPFFFVATQNHVRIYNLAKQALAKKLLAGSWPLLHGCAPLWRPPHHRQRGAAPLTILSGNKYCKTTRLLAGTQQLLWCRYCLTDTCLTESLTCVVSLAVCHEAYTSLQVCCCLRYTLMSFRNALPGCHASLMMRGM